MSPDWIQTLLDVIILVVVFTMGYWTHKIWGHVQIKPSLPWTREYRDKKAWEAQGKRDNEWAQSEIRALRADGELIAELEIPMSKAGCCTYEEERLDPATGYDELFCTTHGSFSYYKVREGSLLPCILFESQKKEN